MPLRDILAPGAVLVTMATAAVVGQNQIQIVKGTARSDIPPVPSSAPAAPGDPGGTAELTGVSFAGRVGFADAGRLTLNRTVGSAYVSDFFVTNPECSDQVVSFGVQILDRNRERLEVRSVVTRVERNLASADEESKVTPGSWLLTPGEADLFRIAIAGPSGSDPAPGWFGLAWSALRSAPMNYGYWTGHLPSTGMLLLTRHSASGQVKTENNVTSCANGATLISRAARPLMLDPPLPSGLDTGVLVASLILALGMTLLCAFFVLRSSTNFWDPMPAAPFDVKNSWAANLAVGGGLITALMTTTILSSDRYSINSASYVLLAALFAALVPLGAALYGLSRPASGPVQGDGYVVSFLGTTLIVLWGAFGQMLLIGMFFRELDLAGVLSPVSAGLLIVATKVVMVSLAIYAVIGSLGTIGEGAPTPQQVQPAPDGRGLAPQMPPLTANRRPAAMI